MYNMVICKFFATEICTRECWYLWISEISDHDIFMCPILELMRLTFRSGHRLTVWYHSFFEAPYAVDELELYMQILI